MKGILNNSIAMASGNPRQSNNIAPNCDSELTIACGNQCNLLTITDSNGSKLDLLAATVSAHINTQAECLQQSRSEVDLGEYVTLIGLNAMTFTHESVSIFPAQGQGLEALKAEILAIVCNCL